MPFWELQIYHPMLTFGVAQCPIPLSNTWSKLLPKIRFVYLTKHFDIRKGDLILYIANYD